MSTRSNDVVTFVFPPSRDTLSVEHHLISVHSLLCFSAAVLLHIETVPRSPRNITSGDHNRVQLLHSCTTGHTVQAIDTATQLEGNLGVLPRRVPTAPPSIATKAFLTPEASGTSPMPGTSPMHADSGPHATSSALNLEDSISVNGGLAVALGGGYGVPMPKADPHELQHIRGVVLLNTAKLRAATWQVRHDSLLPLDFLQLADLW